MPKAKARLLSPHCLFNAEQGVSGRFVIEEDKATLVFDNVVEIVIDYDSGNYLPAALGKSHTPGVAEINLGDVLDESNSNMSPTKKLLVHWYCRCGHTCMSMI